MSNFLEEYIESHKRYCPEDLFEGLMKNKETIEVVSYKDIPEIKEQIESFIKFDPPIPKRCFQNAAEACLAIKGVEYVEGLFGSILPISHAWNCYKGKYFDLTMECNSNVEEDRIYLQLMNIDNQKLRRYLVELKYWGGFTTYHYMGVDSHFKVGI